MRAVLLLIVAACLGLAHGELSVDAFKVMHMEREGVAYGSIRTAMFSRSVLVTPENPLPAELSGRVAVARIDVLTPVMVDGIMSNNAFGLVIVIPEDLSDIASDRLQKWQTLERFFMSKSFGIPIYFVIDGTDVETMLQNLSLQDSQDQYQFVVNGPEAKEMKNERITGHNLHGILKGNSHHSTSDMRTIVIAANYDSFSAVPSLSFGATENASGVSAVLELARVFSKLYADPEMHAPWNIVFLLSSAGALNHAGSMYFLQHMHTKDLDSVDYVFCLDSLSAGPQVFAHASRPRKNPEAQLLYQTIEDVAQQLGIADASVNVERVDLNSAVRPWHHERFSAKHLLATTFSSREDAVPPFNSSSIFDRFELADTKSLALNTRLVGEVILRLMRYEQRQETDDMLVLDGSRQVNEDALAGWMQQVSLQPRVAPFMSGTSTVQELQQALQSVGLESVRKQAFPLPAYRTPGQDNGVPLPDSLGFMSFYGAPQKMLLPLKLSVYRVKPWYFDIIFLFTVGCILFSYHIILRAPKSWSEFVDVVSNP